MDLSQLNPSQRASIKEVTRPLLVLACAGSGKTRVITQKIAYLIQVCNIAPHKILAVTFTNKAAREMQERVRKILPRTDSRGLKISTFHQFGLDFIRKECKQLGYKANFSIFDDQDAKQVIKDVMLQANTNPDNIDLVKQQISMWKNALVQPESAISYATTDSDTHAAICYKSYQRLLNAYNAVDFDDLILLPTQLLGCCDQTREAWQHRIHYLLVDEYQDTNLCQYQLLKYISGVQARFTVVGDDDQSIYGWRGAEPENLKELSKDFPPLEVIKLEQNYRSSQNILAAANAVISHNTHVFEKKIWSALGQGDKVHIQKCKNEDMETDWITGHLLHQKLQKNADFKDFAVLYRSNYQSRVLEIKLQALNIPYKISGGTSFFARSEIKDILAYLRLIINTDDDNAFLRIVNTPRREIGASTLEKLGQYAQSRDTSLYQATFELGLEQSLNGKHLENLRRFTHWIESMSRACHEADNIGPVRQLLTDIEYQDWLRDQNSSAKAAEKRWQNVCHLLASIEKMLEEPKFQKADKNSSPLEKAINQLIIRDIIDQQNEEKETDQVQLMTLHAAKGLEFPCVYIMGLEEDILPHRNSVDEGNLEEERRLFYVGITRAQRQLHLTLCNERKQYGEKMSPNPSRFLKELPDDVIEWHGLGIEKTKEEKQAIGQSYLAGLKEMLSKEST